MVAAEAAGDVMVETERMGLQMVEAEAAGDEMLEAETMGLEMVEAEMIDLEMMETALGPEKYVVGNCSWYRDVES